MALPSAVAQEGLNKVFSYISTKLEDKALTADTIARIEIALSRIDFVLQKTGRIPITYVSLLRRWKVLKRVHKEGMDLLNKYRPQYQPDGLQVTREQAVLRSPSYLERIANAAANLSISSLVKTYEMYADLAEKFVAEVESSCPLRHVSSRYPFLKHLFEGKTIGYKSMVKKPSQTFSLYLHPVIMEGRGIEVSLVYEYEDCRKFEKYFLLGMRLRISEATDIIEIIIKCMQWLTAQFKLAVAVESATGELTQLSNLQDTFHSDVPPPSCMQEEKDRLNSKFFRPYPICCNGNSCGNPANQSSIEFPESVIEIDFSCYVSAPENRLPNNAPLLQEGTFAPHCPCYGSSREICTPSILK